MSGKPGRSGGRPRSAKRLLRDAEAQIDSNFPYIMDAYIEKGLAGNEAILIDLVNRKLGKPKTTTDVNIVGEFPVDMLLVRFREAIDKAKEVQLLEAGITEANRDD